MLIPEYGLAENSFYFTRSVQRRSSLFMVVQVLHEHACKGGLVLFRNVI